MSSLPRRGLVPFSRLLPTLGLLLALLAVGSGGVLDLAAQNTGKKPPVEEEEDPNAGKPKKKVNQEEEDPNAGKPKKKVNVEDEDANPPRSKVPIRVDDDA